MLPAVASAAAAATSSAEENSLPSRFPWMHEHPDSFPPAPPVRHVRHAAEKSSSSLSIEDNDAECGPFWVQVVMPCAVRAKEK